MVVLGSTGLAVERRVRVALKDDVRIAASRGIADALFGRCLERKATTSTGTTFSVNNSQRTAEAANSALLGGTRDEAISTKIAKFIRL